MVYSNRFKAMYFWKHVDIYLGSAVPIGPAHFCLKICCVVFVIFIQSLIEHSVNKTPETLIRHRRTKSKMLASILQKRRYAYGLNWFYTCKQYVQSLPGCCICLTVNILFELMFYVISIIFSTMWRCLKGWATIKLLIQ